MEKIFLEIIRLGMLGSYMALTVTVIRFCLKKIPRSFVCALWILVGMRLVLPFSIESVFGLMPDAEIVERYVRDAGEAGEGPEQGQTFFTQMQEDKQQESPEYLSAEKTQRKNQGIQVWIHAGAVIWLTGMLFMLAYFLYGWYRMKKQVEMAVPEEYALSGEGVRVYRCGGIETPFLFGMIRPKIYLPVSIPEEDVSYIVWHEMAHRKRKDYLVKPAAFLLLALYWFCPCIWMAYLLLCRDMEMACDERVIRGLKNGERKAYSRALLNCTVYADKSLVCPVGFGEPGVKARVKNILNYKKPTLLAAGLGMVVCCVLLLVFMTQRKETDGNGALTEADERNVPVNAEEMKLPEAETGNPEVQNVEARRIQRQADQMQSFLDVAEDQVKEKEEEVEKMRICQDALDRWARAFCDRNGEEILSMSSEELLTSFEENEMMIIEEDYAAFGWSSPWPWDNGKDYRIVSFTDTSAEILYYAWVSDPHVSVWKEKIAYRIENGTCVMESSELEMFDHLSSAGSFYEAYPGGIINDTPMDYLKNGCGEALNDNARANRDRESYARLFQPDTAAHDLLNLLDNENKIEITYEEEEDKAHVTIRFLTGGEADNRAYVTMIRPFGSDGIWIPQTRESMS